MRKSFNEHFTHLIDSFIGSIRSYLGDVCLNVIYVQYKAPRSHGIKSIRVIKLFKACLGIFNLLFPPRQLTF